MLMLMLIVSGDVALPLNSIDIYNTTERTKQFKHETRGIFPANGSAYEDYTIHSTNNIPGLHQMGHFDNDGGGGTYDSAWDIKLSNSYDKLRGYRHNAISMLRDRWENIDPKIIRMYNIRFFFSSFSFKYNTIIS